jgi:MFS family permease
MAEKKKFYGWTLVGVLFVIYLINGAFPYAGASVINAVMAESLQMKRTLLGLGFSIFVLTLGLASPLIALSLNKKGARLTLFIGSLVVALASVLMATVVNQAWRYVIVYGLIMGLGVALGGVLPVQTGITLWFTKKRGLAMGIVLSAAGIGGFIASHLLKKIIAVSNGNWRAAWLVVAALAIMAGIVAILFVRNKPSDLGQVVDGLDEPSGPDTAASAHGHASGRVYRSPVDWKAADAMKTAPAWLILLGAIGFGAPFAAFVAHGVIHLRDIGHPMDISALSVGLMVLFSVIGRLGGGVLADRIEPRYIWTVCLWLVAVGGVLLVNATRPALVYAYSICMGIGFGGGYVCMVTTIGNYFGPKSFASVMGAIFPIFTITNGLTPLLAGMARDHWANYNLAFYALVAVALIGTLVIPFAKPPKPASS